MLDTKWLKFLSRITTYSAFISYLECHCEVSRYSERSEPSPCLIHATFYSVPAAGGPHRHFCEERAEEDPDSPDFRLPRMLRESEGG